MYAKSERLSISKVQDPSVVNDAISFNSSKVRHPIRLGPPQSQDVQHLNPANRQCIREKLPVAPKWKSLGTHDRGGFVASPVHERVQARLELRRFHVIRVPTKTGHAPGGMTRILAGRAPSAQRFEVAIVDAVRFECGGKGQGSEVRMPPAGRESSYIGQPADVEAREKLEERLEGSGRMPDRVDRSARSRTGRTRSPSTSPLSRRRGCTR